jgi:membrane complex biogenesis BtpA family protein
VPSIPGPVIGVVHLLPLPGSPRYKGSMAEIVARAKSDALAYARGGVDGLVVENYGDTPFLKEGLPPETVAALACCAAEVRDVAKLPLGVNALRNDARAALGVAAAVGAVFARVNIHAGVVATDQGLIEGRAPETLRLRRLLGVPIAIAADVHVKHGRPLFAESIGEAARDLAVRAGADAIIVSGAATGAPADPADLEAVRAAAPGTPLLAGSGVRIETVARILEVADAVIVGTAMKRGGRTEAPVDPARVRSFTRAARGAARGRGR